MKYNILYNIPLLLGTPHKKPPLFISQGLEDSFIFSYYASSSASASVSVSASSFV